VAVSQARAAEHPVSVYAHKCAMQKAERVTLIMKLAGTLSERRWQDLDLILEQFGFPTSDFWEGDQYSYVVHHIKAAKEDELLELHEFLFPDEAPSRRVEGVVVEDTTGVWERGYFRLFISHSSKQAGEVGALKIALREHAISGFVAHDDITPTEEWRDVIESALRTCEAMAAYVTPDFHPSNWTDQEIGVCLARAVLIIPIRKGATPYGFLGKYQALAGGTKGPERVAADIYSILESNVLTASRLKAAKIEVEASQAVEALEQAGSYNSARAAFTRLLRVPEDQLTTDQVERIERAAADNYELSAQWDFGPTTVKDEATALVERIRNTRP
jgi:hypothetical protein